MAKPPALNPRSIKRAIPTRTIKEIRKTASRLTLLGQKDAPFDIIEQAALRLMKSHFEFVAAYSTSDYHRGRSWRQSTPPNNVSQLLAPPSDKVKQYGRVNIPGQSVLYVSEFVQTVLNELRLDVNDEVVLLRLRKNEDSPSLYISQLGLLPVTTDYQNLSARE